MPTIIDTDRITFNDNSGQFNAPPLGFKNLQASATGTNANVSVTADQLTLFSTANFMYTANSVSLTINTAASGANGLDTGTIATSTWYSVWVIWNGGTVAGLISTSATAPTLPSGYTHRARVGWLRTDGTANKYPLRFTQYGRRVQYSPASATNLTGLLTMATSSSAVFPTAISVSNYVPTTASGISVAVYGNSSGGNFSISPNQLVNNSSQLSSGNAVLFEYPFILESSNIYYGVSGVLTATVYVRGWEDNL